MKINFAYTSGRNWAFQVVLVVKNLPADAGYTRNAGLIPGSGRFPGEGNGNPLQYSWLENPMDCSLPGSCVHGISQARILDRVAISSSSGSSRPRDQTCIFCISYIGNWILYN